MFFTFPARALVVMSAFIVPHHVSARELQVEEGKWGWGSFGEIYGSFPDKIDFESFEVVALSGNGERLVVADPYAGNRYETGVLQVFERVEGTPTWVQLGKDIVGISGGDRFGKEVSITSDGGRIFVVAPGYDVDKSDDDDTPQVEVGRLRIFDYVDDDWAKVGQMTDVGTATMSGDGNRFVVGRPDKEGIGSAGVFAFDGKELTQLGGWIETDTIGDAFGDVVAINQDGSRIAVGASLYDMDGYPNPDERDYYDDQGMNPESTCSKENDDDENANFGLVRAYEFADGDWSQMGADMVGEVCDKFGTTIDMDADGARIVVGAPEGDNFSPEGDNFRTAGRVRILDYNEGSWTNVGQVIEGENRLQQLGQSVSISADGARVMIATTKGWYAIKEHPVCVYELVEDLWEVVGECIQRDIKDKCGVATISDSGLVVAFVCDRKGKKHEGGVRVFSYLDECMIKKNEWRLQRVDKIVDEYNEKEKRIEKNHVKASEKKTVGMTEEFEECEDDKTCESEIALKMKKQLKRIDKKFDGKVETNEETLAQREVKCLEKFARKASRCE